MIGQVVAENCHSVLVDYERESWKCELAPEHRGRKHQSRLSESGNSGFSMWSDQGAERVARELAEQDSREAIEK